MKGLGLLAPAPCLHLRPALTTCEAEGRVAFASDVVDLFLALDGEGILAGLPVLIYASRPEVVGQFEIG